MGWGWEDRDVPLLPTCQVLTGRFFINRSRGGVVREGNGCFFSVCVCSGGVGGYKR